MDITPYVDTLRRDLVAAAEAGSEELKQAAERLAYALDPSARLALMEAISHAAAEITAELPDGSVDVRLVGRELDFVVEVAPPTSQVLRLWPAWCAARPATTRSTSTSTSAASRSWATTRSPRPGSRATAG
ncbi:hypothetical protein [Nocardioides zeicaulis]|uniref:hypothetical protein n=1 Tax=Nocardioides zeicaulis TaxID=1776857 RepID=UPI0039EF1998